MSYTLKSVIRIRFAKTLLCFILAVIFLYTLFGSLFGDLGVRRDLINGIPEDQGYQAHLTILKDFISEREKWSTSALGALLFKYEAVVTPQDRNFSILVWKHFNWLKSRHINRYGRQSHDAFEGCSVKNCIITGNDSELATVDAVVVHLQNGEIPTVASRNPLQRWIFLNDEAPHNAFTLASKGKRPKLADLVNVFNWSMTYRTDADVPVPYGRTMVRQVPLFKNLDTNSLTEIIPNWKKKRRDVLVTLLMSNCHVKFRMDFIKEFEKHIPVDVYGACSKNKTTRNSCPGHFKSDCKPISEYLFYLALENSNHCNEYITEKVWYHGYLKGAIPIIMGPPLNDCKRLLPPNSYIHIERESSKADIAEIARYIINISEDDNILLSLHQWRNNFKVLNEHGYFGTQSYHWCRVCEALNYNDGAQKIYNEQNLRSFLDPFINCNK